MGSYLDYLTLLWVSWQFMEVCREPIGPGPCILARFGLPFFVGHVLLSLGRVLIL